MRIGLVLAGTLITAALSGGAAAQPAPECARAKTPSGDLRRSRNRRDRCRDVPRL